MNRSNNKEAESKQIGCSIQDVFGGLRLHVQDIHQA